MFIKLNELPTTKRYLVYFLICSTQYLFIQIILPIFLPSIFEFDGLLKISKDSIIFHNLALTKSKEILSQGISAWEIRPENQAPVGLSSLLYLIYPKPIILIPVCAFFQTLTVILFEKILKGYRFSNKAVFITGFLLLIHPVSLLWNSQYHKDTFAVSAILFIIIFLQRLNLGFINCSIRNSYISLIIGTTIIWIVRPYLLEVLMVSILIFTAFLILIYNKSMKRLIIHAFLLNIIMFSFMILSKQNETTLHGAYRPPTHQAQNWNSNVVLPELVDSKLQAISSHRKSFIEASLHGNTTKTTGSNLNSSLETLLFMPFAFKDSIIEPVPFIYINKTKSLASKVNSIIMSFDMIFSYLMLISFVFFLRTMKDQIPLLVFLIFTLTILGFSFPNIGTLTRMRYAFYIVPTFIGLCYFIDRIKNFFHTNPET